MADFNDVVRHVILRIIVDQSTLAAEMAAAREKLKALKNAEQATNKERERNNDAVTKGLEKQNKALDENREAHEAAQRASAGKSGQSANKIKADTAEIKEQTEQVKKRIVEEAKADEIRAETGRKNSEAARNLQSKMARDRAEQRAWAIEDAALSKKLDQDQKDRDDATADRRSAANKRLLADLDKVAASINKTESQIGTENERGRNERLGGNNSRKIQRTTAANSEARKDNAAEEKSQRDLAAFNEAERRKDSAQDEAERRKDEAHNEGERRKNAAAGETERRKNEESAARAAATAARTKGIEDKNRDVKDILDSTRVDRETAVRETAQGKTEVAQQRTESATSIADAAKSRTANAENKKASDDRLRAINEANAADKVSVDRGNRRVAAQSQIKRLQSDIAKYATQQEILESRLADTVERRARAAEKEVRASQARRGLVGTAGALLGDVATAGLRAGNFGSGGALRRGLKADVPDVTSQGESFRRLTTTVGRAETAVSQFFRRFTGGDGEKSLSVMGSLRAKVLGVVDSLNRPRRGGSGSSLFSDIISNFSSLGEKLTGSLSAGRARLLSFQTLIVAVIAALGPLAAVLGGVGAAALGLASNIVALSGSLLALPGILGALIGGFGALALVLKPITSIFSAYSAAQKEAAQGTRVATDAALDHKAAVLSEQEAELAYNRALADKPRAIQKLADARKQASRDIQDYRLQLQKLKFDEEGAALGAESAELDYRKSLVDPTATNLDRRIARHNVEGSLFDQRDQTVAGGRLKEDSAEAFKKGVEGSDAVIEAQRAVEDSTYKIRDSYIAWQKAIIATQKAAEADKAGGTAAAEFQRQIDKLPPKTKKVVLALFELKDAFKAMRDRLSDQIFGPASEETGKFADLLKSLESFLSPAADAMGIFAKKALDLFTNPDWKKFFSEQGVESGHIISQLGDALISTADAFRSITEVARPFTRFVVDGIKGLAASFGDFAKSDEGREKISSFLKNTQKRIHELWPVIKNLAAGFAGFFAALNTSGGGKEDFTTYFNKGLLSASKAFRALGDQARDPNSGFQKWLRGVRPLLHDIVGFLKSAGKFFGDLFSNPANMQEASKTLQAIAKRWLPALAEFFDKLSQSGLVSKLATGIASIFEAVNKFFDHGGLAALSSFASTIKSVAGFIGGVISVVDKLADRFGAFDAILKGIGVTIALVFGAALASKILGISKLIGGIKGLVKGVGNVTGSIADRKDDKRGRIRGAVQDKVDSSKDSFFGRDKGESTARRNARNQAKKDAADQKPDRRNNPRPGSAGSTTPKTPEIDRTGTGGVLPHLSRMEVLLKQIAANTRGGGSRGSGGGDGDDQRAGGGGKPNGGGDGKGKRPSSAERRNGVVVPDLDSSKAGFSPVGPSVVDDGVDPNSAKGRAQRKAAAKQAKADRLARGSTPLGRLERKTGSYTPSKTTTFGRSIKNLFGRAKGGLGKASRGVGKGLLAGLSAYAGLPPLVDDLEDDADRPRPVEAEEPRPGRESTDDRRALPGRPAQLALPSAQAEGRRGLPGPRTQLALPSAPSTIALPGRPDPRDQYSTRRATKPARPGLADTGIDMSVYPGLDDDYTVRQKGQRRRVRGKFAPELPEQPITSLPWVGDDRSPYYTGSTPPTKVRPSQFPGGARKPPARPGLADAGRDLSVYPGLDDDYTVQKPRRRVGGRFAPDLPDRPSLAIPGRDFSPYAGLDDDYTVARARDAKGRFLPKSKTPAKFNPIDINELDPYVRPLPAHSQRNLPVPATQAPAPVVTSERRSRSTAIEGEILPPVAAEQPQSGRRERSTTIDGEVVDGPSGSKKKGFFGRLRDRARRVAGSDEGSFNPFFGAFGEEDTDTKTVPTRSRRGRTTRPGGTSRPGGRPSRPGARPGARPATRPAGVTGIAGAVLGDEEYKEGYEDGLAASGGSGLDLPDRDGDRDGKGKGRRGTAVEGDIVDEDESTRRGRRGTVIDGEATETSRSRPGRARRLFGRRGGTATVGREVESLARGGRLGGLVKGLGGKLGGGLLRGAVGGIGGLVGGVAASVGGDYLINKFVKNDNDASSLQRGLGAVSTGAGIGATIGSIIPGVGTVIGGAVGGLAGGAYSLFKDKNLRSFVGDKLGGAAKGVGGFLKNAGGAVSGALGGVFGGLFGGGKKDDEEANEGPVLRGSGRRGRSLDPSQKMGVAGTAGIVSALGPVGALLAKTDIGANIIQSLARATNTVKAFFTKTIPNAFSAGIKGITNFFTKTLPSLPGKAFDAITTGFGVLLGFFQYKVPRAAEAAWNGIKTFFTKTLPNVASAAWDGITGFFTETLPNAASAAWDGITGFFTETLPNVASAAWGGITNFFTETLPNVASAVWGSITGFFTETLPKAAQQAWDGITHFFTDTLPNVLTTLWNNISTFFGTTLPNFFTVTLPDAIRSLPGLIMDNIVTPVVDFFKGIADHIGDFFSGGWDWVKGLFSRAGKNIQAGKETQKHMSGGLIQGVYQGIQDTAHVMATPGEFMVRKSRVDEPGAKAFLRDFNENGMASLYSGLSASTQPRVMSMVPPDAQTLTGKVPTVVNNTVNHAPVMGDVTINNPVRERSEHSLRRQVQIAAIRHRR